ncbi:MAG: GNAT family N-acetyltransferase [Acidobacteria bacterium]|nr:GNAT family N-acetyltransferase [Acidobacteriota bacterium]
MTECGESGALNIRLATGDDFEWAAQLMASMDPWRKLGRDFNQRLSLCRHPEYTLLIAESSESRLACALMHQRGVAGSPYLASLAVLPQEQSRGVGSALLAFCESYFEGARFFFLCVGSFNPRARALYERKGYTQVGELPDYAMVGASEFLYVKRMAP